jgi:hypothetical protein
MNRETYSTGTPWEPIVGMLGCWVAVTFSSIEKVPAKRFLSPKALLRKGSCHPRLLSPKAPATDAKFLAGTAFSFYVPFKVRGRLRNGLATSARQSVSSLLGLGR